MDNKNLKPKSQLVGRVSMSGIRTDINKILRDTQVCC